MNLLYKFAFSRNINILSQRNKEITLQNYQKFLFILLVGTLFFWSSCFLPENFEANITIRQDGSYLFQYNGNLVFAMALSAQKEGKLSKEDKKSLKEQEKHLLETPGFKKAEYIGNTRYKVLVEKSGKSGEDYYFLSKDMSIFSIRKQKDGSLAIKAFQMSAKDLEGLKSVNVTIAGTLSVLLDKGVKVIEHNADKVTPGLYQWKLKNPEKAPFIIVKP